MKKGPPGKGRLMHLPSAKVWMLNGVRQRNPGRRGRFSKASAP